MRSVSAPDRAILGASIRTLWPRCPHATAVAFRGGTIVAVGGDDEIRELCGGTTEIVDGTGLALVPGLTDAHQHPIWAAELAVGADLNGLTTLDAVRAALLREGRRVGPGGWIRGWGLDYAAFGERPVEASAIADAVADHPALLIFYDLHTALASEAALARAGVQAPREFADRSEIACRDGVPTGALYEPSAYRLVLDATPPLSQAERVANVQSILAAQHAVGVAGIHVMDGGPETIPFLTELETQDALTMRLIVPLWQTPGTAVEEMRAQLELREAHGRLWRGGVAKFFIDGVIEPGTAWLEEADELGDSTQPFWQEPERYAAAVRLFAEAGFQCATHAVGDRAVRAALDAYATAGAAAGVRHRIEHIETAPDGHLARFASEGVVASMQPLHMQWRREDHSDAFARRLGPVRAGRAFRTRDLLDSGALVALGSDWPVADSDPRLGMAWARLRRRPGDPDAPVFEPEQRLTALETLHGYTTWAARTVGESDCAGRIAPGFRADITAFSEDPVECSADELIDLPVRLVIVDGRIVHDDIAGAAVGSGGRQERVV